MFQEEFLMKTRDDLLEELLEKFGKNIETRNRFRKGLPRRSHEKCPKIKKKFGEKSWQNSRENFLGASREELFQDKTREKFKEELEKSWENICKTSWGISEGSSAEIPQISGENPGENFWRNPKRIASINSKKIRKQLLERPSEEIRVKYKKKHFWINL